MVHAARRHAIALALLTALCASATPVAAQEGSITIDATPRHGYFFKSRQHSTPFIYCGFSRGGDHEVLVFRRSLEAHEWMRVGFCNSSRSKGTDSIAVGDPSTLFIFVLPKERSPASGGGWSGTKTITNEASNDCGIRLKFSATSGEFVRLVLLDHGMAFGHGVPITKVCDPLLDHYDHF